MCCVWYRAPFMWSMQKQKETNAILYRFHFPILKPFLTCSLLYYRFFTKPWYMCVYSYIWASLVAQTIKNLPAMQETQVRSLGLEDLLEKGIATHSSILPGEFHGQRSLVGYSSRGYEELDTIQQLNIHIIFIFLGGGNVLAWLPSMWCNFLFLSLCSKIKCVTYLDGFKHFNLIPWLYNHLYYLSLKFKGIFLWKSGRNHFLNLHYLCSFIKI